MFKLVGQVKVLNDTEQISEKFSKREFVIVDDASMYPQDIIFQAVQDKCAMLDGINVGDRVEVSFNLRGKEWTSPTGEVKYFNSLDAWRIEALAGGASVPQAPIEAGKPDAVKEDEDDSLPF